jgi:hypothetical protein
VTILALERCGNDPAPDGCRTSHDNGLRCDAACAEPSRWWIRAARARQPSLADIGLTLDVSVPPEDVRRTALEAA